MGRKGHQKKYPSAASGSDSQPHWLQQFATRIDANKTFLDLDARRRYWSEEDAEAYLNTGSAASSSSFNVGVSRLSLPPPKVAQHPDEAWTQQQRDAWQEEMKTPPGDGLKPTRQPRDSTEELQTLVLTRCNALNFCPADRAVMVCGRPVVVTFQRRNTLF